MNKQEIILQLKNNHLAFIQYIDTLNERDFLYAPQLKWNAGQQLDHIHRSTAPVLLALSLPKFMLKVMFGKSNRPSKNYVTLIEKYNQALTKGGKASGRFIPKPVAFNQKQSLVNALNNTIDKLSTKIENLTEEQLDVYILPHPLLGKLTLREMLYFTIHHVKHHHDLTIQYLHK
ncbi:MAG: DinB family protein [Bacteroidia bacterium]